MLRLLISVSRLASEYREAIHAAMPSAVSWMAATYPASAIPSAPMGVVTTGVP